MFKVYLESCISFVMRSDGQTTYLPCTNVLILKPMVGLMVEMSSPLSFLRMVVFPALSRPLLASRQVHGRILRRKVEQRARRGYASLFLSSCSSVLPSRGPSQMSVKIQKRDRLCPWSPTTITDHVPRFPRQRRRSYSLHRPRCTSAGNHLLMSPPLVICAGSRRALVIIGIVVCLRLAYLPEGYGYPCGPSLDLPLPAGRWIVRLAIKPRDFGRKYQARLSGIETIPFEPDQCTKPA